MSYYIYIYYMSVDLSQPQQVLVVALDLSDVF